MEDFTLRHAFLTAAYLYLDFIISVDFYFKDKTFNIHSVVKEESNGKLHSIEIVSEITGHSRAKC